MSSPVSARVSAPPDLKECMVNAVLSPALRACTLSAFVISGADMDVFLLRACINVLIESVHKICRQNLSKIKLCDWPNKLDATSWQV